MTNKTTLLVSFVALSASAFAVDGVTLINQATIATSGGFPYTISQTGSYKLSGNIVVPSSAFNAIKITAANVTLDMNGFTLSCLTCTSGLAIDSSASGTAISNGAITGFPYIGVLFGAGQASLDRVSFNSNGSAVVSNDDLSVTACSFTLNSSAISVNGTASLMVINSRFIRNQRNAISGPSALGAVITGNVFVANGTQTSSNDGAIIIYSGTVTANTFINNWMHAIQSSGTGPVIFSQNSFNSYLGSTNYPTGTGVISAGNNGCMTGVSQVIGGLC